MGRHQSRSGAGARPQRAESDGQDSERGRRGQKPLHVDFGNCVALAESPLVDGLIYVGTDDGLVQVTQDAGENWRKIPLFPCVPDMTYVSCLTAS